MCSLESGLSCDRHILRVPVCHADSCLPLCLLRSIKTWQ